MPEVVQPGAHWYFLDERGGASGEGRFEDFLISLDDFSSFRFIYSAPLLPAVTWFLYGDTDYWWCFSPCGFNSSTMALTLALFWNVY